MIIATQYIVVLYYIYRRCSSSDKPEQREVTLYLVNNNVRTNHVDTQGPLSLWYNINTTYIINHTARARPACESGNRVGALAGALCVRI